MFWAQLNFDLGFGSKFKGLGIPGPWARKPWAGPPGCTVGASITTYTILIFWLYNGSKTLLELLRPLYYRVVVLGCQWRGVGGRVFLLGVVGVCGLRTLGLGCRLSA